MQTIALLMMMMMMMMHTGTLLLGGAIVVSPTKSVIESVGKVYAGRASSSPIVDLFITLLSMGLKGYKALLEQRQSLLTTFPERFGQVATKYGERFLTCPSNAYTKQVLLNSRGYERIC